MASREDAMTFNGFVGISTFAQQITATAEAMT